jgi:hypothetical protein
MSSMNRNQLSSFTDACISKPCTNLPINMLTFNGCIFTPGNLLTRIVLLCSLNVMIEEIKTRSLEMMVCSNSCLNLCYKNLCKQKNTSMPIPHGKDISITQNYILTLTIINRAEFEIPVGMATGRGN